MIRHVHSIISTYDNRTILERFATNRGSNRINNHNNTNQLQLAADALQREDNIHTHAHTHQLIIGVCNTTTNGFPDGGESQRTHNRFNRRFP